MKINQSKIIQKDKKPGNYVLIVKLIIVNVTCIHIPNSKTNSLSFVN